MTWWDDMLNRSVWYAAPTGPSGRSMGYAAPVEVTCTYQGDLTVVTSTEDEEAIRANVLVCSQQLVRGGLIWSGDTAAPDRVEANAVRVKGVRSAVDLEDPTQQMWQVTYG